MSVCGCERGVTVRFITLVSYTCIMIFLPTGIGYRSEVDVFSGVCLSVCPHDNFRIVKRRTVKLGG